MEKFYAVVQNKWVTFFSRIFIGGLFALGAGLKLQDVKQYSVNAVYEYGLLPTEPIDIAAIFGYILPYVEFVVGLCILFGVLTRLTSLLGSLMGLSFFSAEAIVLMQGRDLNCGCFPGLVGTMMSVTVYLSFFMMVLGFLIYKSPNRNFLSLTNVIFKDKDKSKPSLLQTWS